MKGYRLIVLIAVSVLFLTSCDYDVSMETTVHEDGRLDKVIGFKRTDTAKLFDFKRSGWTKVDKENAYKKSFASVAELNKELATDDDTLFHITGTFEKNFRWFYTYIYYAETYHAINRMKLPIGDYMTSEDYAFIERLPSEGKAISKADELYLTRLNEKLFDIYGARAIYEESFAIQVQLLKKHNAEPRWLDTLAKHKEYVFRQISEEKDVSDDFLYKVMDRCFQMPMPHSDLKKEYVMQWKTIERKLKFISEASEGKYVNRINMPWTVVKTNADSVIGNQLLWKPPAIKFLVNDYTMYAEVRAMNYWALMLSAVLVGLTVYLFVRKRST